MAEGRTKKLAKETGWFAIGNFGSKILTLLLVPFYTNILTTGEYGTVDIIMTTINLLIPVLTLEMANGIFRFALDKECDTKSVATNCILITVLSSIALLAIYPLINWVLPTVTEYWWYFFFIYMFNSLSSILASFMKGIDKSHIFAIQGIIYTFVFALSNIVLLLWVKLGVKGYLLSLVLAHIASCVFLIIAGRVKSYFSLSYIDKTLLKDILKFSAPLIPAAVAWWIMSSIDRYMLLYMCGTDANGLYGVAHKLPSIITVLTNFFINAWQISAIRNMNDEDAAEYTSKIYKIMFITGTAICFVMITASELIGRFMFAKEFFPAWTMTPSLSISTIFSTFTLFIGAQFTASKRSDLHLKSNIIAMVANVILNYLLIKTFGINGAAYGTMISYFIVLVYRQHVIKGLIDFKYDALKLYLTCGLLMGSGIAISFDIPFYYVISILAFGVVILLYRKDYVEITTKVGKLILGEFKKS